MKNATQKLKTITGLTTFFLLDEKKTLGQHVKKISDVQIGE